uniref:Uncharacterized protein n=1 Tax=Nymphaea colorata TaxID=210225 RepID=A0A5K1FI88_9MAGN
MILLNHINSLVIEKRCHYTAHCV